MSDVLLEAIRAGRIHAGNISFEEIRSIAGRDCGCWEELGRGRNILTTHDQLDQYLHSYGPMIKCQWGQFLQKVTIPNTNMAVRILDYGCGQGLACTLLFDNLGRDFLKRVQSIVLVEPSGVALKRATGVLGCYLGTRPLLAIQKKLDELTPRELGSVEGVENIHVFSNVLDIEGFQRFELFTKILNIKGRHCVLAVSHNRDFYGGAARIKELAVAIDISAETNRSWFKLSTSRIDEFICKGKPAISWELRVEV